MRAATKPADKKNLQELVPLDALSEARFAEIAKKITIEEVRKGRYLFREGDRDGYSMYLLEGKINLIDGHRKVVGEVEAGTDASRYPLANQQPRTASARAVTRVVIAHIDSGLLDVFLTWDQTSSTEVTEIKADNDQDWMTRMLQSDAFARIPPALIQRLLMQMEPFPVHAGDVVISEGEAGDYFYTIGKGRCAVTSRTAPDGGDVKLAELSDGDFFGEGALVSESPRNATVTMLTDGLLMRLAKTDFVELLKNTLVQNVSFDDAVVMVDEGAVWLDVRSPGEYEAGSFEDSVNIPLVELRGEMPELVFNVKYVICCDTARRSSSAAFILSHKGFEVYVLDGGLNGLASGSVTPAGLPAQAGTAGQVDGGDDIEQGADVISFNRNPEIDTVGALASSARSVLESTIEDTGTGVQPGFDTSAGDPERSRLSMMQQEEVDDLRNENLQLQQEIGTLQDREHDLTGRLAGLHQLEQELEVAHQELSSLQQRVENGSDEAHLLREQYAALQEEYTDRVGRLEQELDQSRTQLESLRAEFAAGKQKQEQLEAEVESGQLSRQAGVEHLEAELVQARQRAESLQTELAGANGQVAQLRSDAELSGQEQQRLTGELREELQQSHRQIEVLQGDVESLREARQATDEAAAATVAEQGDTLERLQAELTQARAQAESLQAELAGANGQAAQLRSDAESSGQEQQRLIGELREELQQSHRQIEVLQGDVESLREARQATDEAAAATVAEQDGMLERLQAELVQAREQAESLQAELAGANEQAAQLRSDAESSGQEQQQLVVQLRSELAQVRTDNDEFERQLGEERSEAAGLRHQLDELAAQLEAEREQYRDNSEQMQREAETAAAGKQEIERQLEALQQEHRSDREQLASITVEYSDVQSSLQLLRQENASLREEKRQLQSQQEEQAEQLANISQDTQMAEEVRDRLQQEWAAERDALKEELAGRSTQIDELRIRLEQSQEALDRERERQEDLQSSITKADERLEQNELRYTELQQEQALVADEYQAVLVERDSLREKVAETLQSQTAQQEEIEALNTRIASLTETSDEASRKLNEQLQDAQKHVAEASRQIDEQVAQVESLHRDLAETREEKIRLEVETQTLQQRMEEMQQEVQQLDGRSRALDQQNQDALNKAYEDLTRKNDTEKELQGQIERLRKKLEQTGEELLEAHNEARENTEHFREELNAERRARAEERAQLAARQKELKEQLATIAHQHEAVLSTQEGVLAQVKDSAREEQSSRLQQALLAHEQAEEQIAGLQNELARAHEETAQAVQQDRERYQADLALAREQKTEADETVARIEAQLNQLMQERDAALAEQQGIREQLNSLRAEVEVARGLMGTDEDGRVADPAEMQAELEEMKKNIKIAIRLRSEAEAQRDKSLKEMIELKRQYEKEGPAGARLHVPSLDEAEEKNPQTRSQSQPLAGRGAGTPGAKPNGKRPVFRYVVEWGNGGKRVWLGKAIGLGMAGIAALVFWLMLNSENPVIPETKPVARDVAVPALTAPNVPADRAETANEADRDNPAGMQADQESGNTEAVPESQTVAEDVPSQAQHALDIQDAQEVQDVPEIPDVVAGRSFRDSLQGGSKGPLMVELPAASYLMGSPGNSLNFEERPQHRVDLGAFSISKHEVSFAEYDRFARATGQRLPHDEGWGRGNQPVINVSWKNANAYVRWLSRQTGRKYRLPTESEWEFAARAGTTRDHWWDPDTESAPANCFDCGSRWDGKRTTAVGSFPANRFGLHDTAGNVQEWTEDCYYPNYQDAARDGSARQGRRCTQRVVRGGSYSSPVDSLRSAKRGQYDQDTRLDNLGFRVVRVE